MYNIIKEYINNLSIIDIKTYCIKKNINLTDSEINILYHTLKTNWEQLYQGNYQDTFNYLEKHLSINSFKLVKDTYFYYKNKVNF